MIKNTYSLEGIHSRRIRATGNFAVEVEIEGEKKTFYVEMEVVEYVLNNLQHSISDAEAALVLGYLEYAKKENKKNTNAYSNASIAEQALIDVTAELIKEFSVEGLIQHFREKKWHEIVSIYNSADPILELIGEEPPYQGEDDD